MWAITRFDYDHADRAVAELSTCLQHLEDKPGFVRGGIANAIDDPQVWVLQTQWRDVGSYRRALSSTDVKMYAMPLLYAARDEPSAFEVVVGEGAVDRNEIAPRNTDDR